MEEPDLNERLDHTSIPVWVNLRPTLQGVAVEVKVKCGRGNVRDILEAS